MNSKIEASKDELDAIGVLYWLLYVTCNDISVICVTEPHGKTPLVIMVQPPVAINEITKRMKSREHRTIRPNTSRIQTQHSIQRDTQWLQMDEDLPNPGIDHIKPGKIN